MRSFRVYVDTSVLGGCFDPEFAEWSLSLIQDFRLGRLAPVLSEVIAAEVEPAPSAVRELHEELLLLPAEVVRVTSEALSLVTAYQQRGVLSPRYRNDMLHIALATIARVDVLVSWNFRHIVRLDKIRAFNAVNAERGLGDLSIYSPREVTFYGEE
ncbi:MAG: PIN domain-containing protein [Deltaproteobacteria bacterium]|nr:PIN domain-containing protein [Deltaproteobacteria bacterium]